MSTSCEWEGNRFWVLSRLDYEGPLRSSELEGKLEDSGSWKSRHSLGCRVFRGLLGGQAPKNGDLVADSQKLKRFPRQF